MSSGPESWHPKLQQLHAYWHSLRSSGGRLPGRQHIDPADIPQLLPGIWILDVQHEPFRLRYRLAGTMMRTMHNRELTGLWMDEAFPQLTGTPGYFDRYRKVVENKEPSWRRGRPLLEMDRNWRELENLVLPLAGNGDLVDMLLCCTVVYRNDGSEY